MNGIKECLESSTIHGLVYISTSRVALVKCFWMTVVLSGFFLSTYLIQQSFLEWEESPFGTSEETVSIRKVTFPKITVCPPRGSHTALNYYLEKSKKLELSDQQKKELVEFAGKLVEERESWEIMMDNLVFKEEGKFRNWYEGKSPVTFQFERIRLPPSIIQTMETQMSGDNPDMVYSNNFRTDTKATSGSLETPWLGQPFDEKLFIPNLDFR